MNFDKSCEGGKWDYKWIGEFGEMENYRWSKINSSGKNVNDLDVICEPRHASGVFGMEYFTTQELYFEVGNSKWNGGKSGKEIPESICSKPCPMGQIKNFEVFMHGMKENS